jgi:hypothetical protein
MTDAPDQKADSVPSQQFRWEDMDDSLVALKLTDLAVEMHSRIEADEKRIRFENRQNKNTNCVPSQVLQMKQHRADEWARRTYEIYCDIWRTQGYVKSAAFLRALYVRAIRPMLAARSGAIANEFSMSAGRTSFPVNLTNAHLTGIRLNMQRLEDHWRRRLESEAKECDYAERRNKPTEVTQPASSKRLTDQPNRPQKIESSPTDGSRLEAIIRMVQHPQAHTVLSTPEAALYFRVATRTVYRWVDEGKLKNGARRGSITIESIQRWARKRSRKRSST